MTSPAPDDGYDYSLGFEAWTGPAELLPVRPIEPPVPGPDAAEAERAAYVEALAAHADAMRRYEGDLAVLTQANGNWSQQHTPLYELDQAVEVVKEFMGLHATNPLVRNAGLFRTPNVVWERVELPEGEPRLFSTPAEVGDEPADEVAEIADDRELDTGR